MITYRGASRLLPISEVVKLLDEGGFQIPEFARKGFSWSPEQVLDYLESIYDGWPVGAILLFDQGAETGFPAFDFIKDFPTGSKTPKLGKHVHPCMVIDGYRRLQCLYIAMMGWYDQRAVYFKLNAGEDERKFYFLKPRENKDKMFLQLSALRSFSNTKNLISQINIPSDKQLADHNFEAVFSAFYTIYNVCLMPVQQERFAKMTLEIFERMNNHGFEIELNQNSH